MKDYAGIHEDIEARIDALDRYGRKLDYWLDQVILREDEWVQHYDEVVTQLREEGGRLPGEDVRLATARRTGEGRTLYFEMQKAKRTAERYEKRLTRERAALSGLQSQLSAWKAEQV